MAKQKQLAIATILFPSEDIKLEAIQAYCEEEGFLNEKAAGNIPSDMTEEQFFTRCIGKIILKKLEARRTRAKRAKLTQDQRTKLMKAADDAKNELKNLEIK